LLSHTTGAVGDPSRSTSWAGEMSDIVEIDTGDEMTARIVAAWEAVARAGDDLKRAAEQLPAEDERVRS